MFLLQFVKCFYSVFVKLKKYVRSSEDECLWDEGELLPVNFAKLIVRSPVTNLTSRNNSANVYDAPIEMRELRGSVR